MATQKMIKGIPYEVVEGAVILYKPDEEPVKLPLEWGQNAYAIAYAHLNRKGKGVRGSNGKHVIGNFTYQVEESVMTITRNLKDDEVLGTFELTEPQIKYPRNAAIKFVLETVE